MKGSRTVSWESPRNLDSLHEAAVVHREYRLRPTTIEHLSTLVRAQLTGDLSPLATRDVYECRNKNDRESAQDVDETAFHVVTEVVFGVMRRPWSNFEEGPIAVVIVKGVGVMVY